MFFTYFGTVCWDKPDGANQSCTGYLTHRIPDPRTCPWVFVKAGRQHAFAQLRFFYNNFMASQTSSLMQIRVYLRGRVQVRSRVQENRSWTLSSVAPRGEVHPHPHKASLLFGGCAGSSQVAKYPQGKGVSPGYPSGPRPNSGTAERAP